MPKINREEYEILKELDNRAKSIVRQARGWLWVAEQPIMKDKWSWFVADGFDEKLKDDRLFQFIQWENQEPYNIAELIVEYEDSKEYKDSLVIEYFMDKVNESEETEVRKEEIINGLRTLRGELANNYKDNQRIGFIAGVNRVIEFIHSTDEPEVLTQEWIEAHTYHEDEYDFYYMDPDEVKEVLVPKQELPVIPRHVADCLNHGKNELGYNMYDFMHYATHLDEVKPKWKRAYEWIKNNTDKFAKVYLNNEYRIEKESQYFVKVNGKYLSMVRIEDRDSIGSFVGDIEILYEVGGKPQPFTKKEVEYLEKYLNIEVTEVKPLPF